MPSLGIDVVQSTVAKYMAKHPSQGWDADGVASMDLTVGARCTVVSFWMSISISTDVRTDFDILRRKL